MIEPTPGSRLVSLISFRTLGRMDVEPVRRFQRTIRDALGLTAVVVGGGYGCTRVIVKIVELESDDPEEINRVLRELLQGETFRREARKVPFDVLITSEPYERRDLRTGKVDGFMQPVTIYAKEVTVGEKSGDTYNVSRAGVVGAHAKVMNFNQIWSEWKSDDSAPDVAQLAAQLGTLRQQLKSEAKTPEEDAAIGAVAQAEVAAKTGDGSKVLEALVGAGKWALGVAEKIGVALAAGAIRKSLGLP